GSADMGWGEIVGEALLLLRRGHADEPEQEKEGHHGCHEVGIGYLPGAAVVGMRGLLDLLDDDRPVAVVSHIVLASGRRLRWRRSAGQWHLRFRRRSAGLPTSVPCARIRWPSPASVRRG